MPELDRLLQSAYEDKVLGKIPENLCVQLLNGYEAERKAKQERRRELTEQLAASRENEQSVEDVYKRQVRFGCLGSGVYTAYKAHRWT